MNKHMLHVVLFVCGVVVGYAIATIWPISTSFEQCVLTMLAANQRKTWPSSFASTIPKRVRATQAKAQMMRM